LRPGLHESTETEPRIADAFADHFEDPAATRTEWASLNAADVVAPFALHGRPVTAQPV
jgi:hypothetical protein